MNSPSTPGVGQQRAASQRWARGTGCSEHALHRTAPRGAGSTHSFGREHAAIQGLAASMGRQFYTYIIYMYFKKLMSFLFTRIVICMRIRCTYS